MKEDFEAYLVREIRAAAARQEALRRNVRGLMSSNYGEALVNVIHALVQKFKDDHVFDTEVDDLRRRELRASVITLNTLLSHLVELATESEEEEGGVVPGLPSYAPSWAPTVGAEFEDER